MNLHKKTYIIITLVFLALFAVGTYFFLATQQAAELASGDQTEVVKRSEIGLEFSYEAGHDALSLIEPPVNGEPLKGAFILMPSTDYVLIHNDPTRETPPSISIFVFTGNASSTAEEGVSRIDVLKKWAVDNQALTGINIATAEPTEVVLDGLKGITYTTEGTPNQDIHLFSYRNHIYMFVGQYNDENDAIRTAYQDILKTVMFN